MGRRKDSESHIRKLHKATDYTYTVSIPKREIDHLGWREKQKVVVKRIGKRLVIRDWKK